MSDQQANVEILIDATDNAGPIIDNLASRTDELKASLQRMSTEMRGARAVTGDVADKAAPKLSGAFAILSQHASSGEGSIRRLTFYVARLAHDASGVPGPIARITEGLLLFSGGHLAVLGVAAAVAALALGIKALAGDFSEHSKRVAAVSKEYATLAAEQEKVRARGADIAVLHEVLTVAVEKNRLATQNYNAILRANYEEHSTAAQKEEALALVRASANRENEKAVQTALQLHAGLLRLNEAAIKRRQALLDENAVLAGHTKLQVELDALVRENVTPALIAQIRTLLERNVRLKEAHAAQLDAAESAANWAKAMYGTKAAADAAQIALVELKARQEGLTEVEVRGRVERERANLARAREDEFTKLAAARLQTLKDEAGVLEGISALDRQIAEYRANRVDPVLIAGIVALERRIAADRIARTAALDAAEALAAEAKVLFGIGVAGDAAAIALARLKAAQAGLSKEQIEAAARQEQLTRDNARALVGLGGSAQAAMTVLTERFTKAQSPAERMFRLIGDNVHMWERFKALVASGLSPDAALAALEAIADKTSLLERAGKDLGAGFATAFEAIIAGNGASGESFKKFLADVSKQEAAHEFAEGVAKLAAGTWPPNPIALRAAAGHFEAAALFAVIAAAGGGYSGGGSSAGAPSAAGATTTTGALAGAAPQGDVTFYLENGFTTDPTFLDRLAGAIGELTGRNVVVRPAP